jgi:hypothetical protein
MVYITWLHFGLARRSDLASRRAFFALLQSCAFKRSMVVI